MFWELFVVLKLKYVDHIYQVYGTFEHQNSLSMFSILIGMVFLAMTLGPKHRRSNLYLAGFVACAAIVQSTLSRGGLAISAVGTVAVVVMSLIDRPTKRRIVVTSSIAAIGIFGLMMTYSTIVARFNDYGNDESKRTRDMLNVSSKMMLRDYPLGIGWNNFAMAINHPFPYSAHIDAWHRFNGNPVDRHYKKGVVESLYWLHLAETGYQGLLMFILFMGYFLWLNILAMFHFRGKALGALSIGIFLGCTMNYLQSFLERILTQPRNMLLWFLLLAVTGKIEHWRRQEKRMRKAELEAKRFDPVSAPNDRSEDFPDEEEDRDFKREPAHA
ncbi:MAG: O-antigen ligase family protein [Verrucomicrobiales bacterium]